MTVPVPTVVPTDTWSLLTGDPMSPYAGSNGVTIITTGGPALQLSNLYFNQTYAVNQAVPGAITLTFETDNLVIGQNFTVKDDLGDANVNNITVSFGGTLECDGAMTRVLATSYASETYEWNGTQFNLIATADE